MIVVVAEAFVGDRMPVTLNQRRAFAAFGSHERLAVRQPHAGNVDQRQRFGGFLAQCVEALRASVFIRSLKRDKSRLAYFTSRVTLLIRPVNFVSSGP